MSLVSIPPAIVRGIRALPLLVLAVASTTSGCLPSPAAQSPNVSGEVPLVPLGETRRVAYLTPGQAQDRSPTLDAFRGGLREQGLTEEARILLDVHYSTDGDVEITSVARTAVESRPDVIVSVGTPRVEAVRRLTTTIPIVMLNVSDPVEAGLVASIVRPGGNVTGMSTNSGALAAKRLEVLKEALPDLRHVAALATPRWQETTTPAYRQWRETRAAAEALGVEVRPIEIRAGSSSDETKSNIEAGVAAAQQQGAQAVTIIGDAIFDRFRDDIAESAMRARLPSMHLRADFVDEGGLMAYGPDVFAQARQASRFVGKLLQGAKPADLPVEQPAEFEFVINLRTAGLLGVTITPAVVDRATRLVR
jgi:putative tryptophan/tyrosine transport system substrate-binding protein